MYTLLCALAINVMTQNMITPRYVAYRWPNSLLINMAEAAADVGWGGCLTNRLLSCVYKLLVP